MKADTEAVDRNESISAMEPLLISDSSRHRGALNDLAFELTQKSAGFRRSLPRPTQTPLASLVRAMNCYYSNLIEGHDTHPIDIELALKDDYSQDRKKRNLQIEAKAHMTVQQWIDKGGLSASAAVSPEGITELHRRFYEHLPEDLLWAVNPDTGDRVRVVAGELRRQDVKIGQHVAISPGALPRFLARFAEAYGGLGKVDGFISAAAAHHRLLWMHPFLDGNGRVARLMSHATLLGILDTGAVWSVARGLARNVQQYKTLLANCDATRRNDSDGRGLERRSACRVHALLPHGLHRPGGLHGEPRSAGPPQGACSGLGRRLTSGRTSGAGGADSRGGSIAANCRVARWTWLRVPATGRDAEFVPIEKGVLASEGTRAPLHLAFPANVAQRWMPGLFPERAE